MAVLTPEQIYGLADQYFGDLGPQAVDTMARIAIAESGGRTDAHNAADPYGGSYGLWQVNGVHGYSPAQLMDPAFNAAAARQVFDQQGPNAWSTFTNGMFRNALDAGSSLLGGGPLGAAGNALSGWLGGMNWGGGGGNDGGGDGMQEFDPGDPYNSKYTADQRVSYLDDAKATYISGNGANALWRLPSGETVKEANAFQILNDAGFKPGSSGGQQMYSIGGKVVRIGPDGRAQVIYDGSGGADPKLAEVWQRDYANKTTIDNFLNQKLQYELSTGQVKEAAATRQQIVSNSIAMQKLQNDIAQTNFENQFRVQQANITNKRNFASDMASLGEKIGNLASDAGDRGKYASFVMANSPWNGSQETALANGQTFQTQDSLLPLEQLLRIRQNAMGGPEQMVGAPQLSAGLNLGALPGMTQQPTQPGSQQGAIPNVGPDFVPQYDPNTPDAMPNATAPTYGPSGSLIGPPVPKAANGGIEDSAYISGEKGPEINIPLGNGKVAVLNQKQAESVGINIGKLMKMAGGGIFDGLAGDNGDRGLATSFINDAYGKASAGTPFAVGPTPTPLVGATPGLDPDVLNLAASLSALKTGMSQNSFKRMAALLTPQGINEGTVRRTA